MAQVTPHNSFFWIKKIARWALVGTALFVLSAVVFPHVTFADQSSAFQKGAGFVDPQDPRKIVALLATGVVMFLGTLLMMYTVWGGYMIMTASGIEDRIAQGQRAIWTSLVGATILLGGYGITRYVIILTNYATQTNQAEFQDGQGASVDINVQQNLNTPQDPLYEPGYNGNILKDTGFIK